MGSQPVDIKKEGEPRLLWKGEPRAWCTCPETEQASLPFSVIDPGTFLETPISIIPKAPGRHCPIWGDTGRPLEWVEQCAPKPYVEVLTASPAPSTWECGHIRKQPLWM